MLSLYNCSAQHACRYLCWVKLLVYSPGWMDYKRVSVEVSKMVLTELVSVQFRALCRLALSLPKLAHRVLCSGAKLFLVLLCFLCFVYFQTAGRLCMHLWFSHVPIMCLNPNWGAWKYSCLTSNNQRHFVFSHIKHDPEPANVWIPPLCPCV